MRFFKVFHYLSLDVVIGAVSMHQVFYHLYVGNFVSWSYDLILGLSVFLIYGVDRQIDNYIGRQHDALHRFHAHYQQVIRILLALVMLGLGLLLIRAEIPLISFGLGLLVFILIYWLAWIKGFFGRFWGSKECVTALIYGLGVSLPTLMHASFSWLLLASVGQLGLLALLNLGLFTLIEEGGQERLWISLSVLSAFGLITLALMGITWGLWLIFFLIWGIHLGIYYFRAQKPARYLGELAFLSPLIYFIWPF